MFDVILAFITIVLLLAYLAYNMYQNRHDFSIRKIAGIVRGPLAVAIVFGTVVMCTNKSEAAELSIYLDRPFSGASEQCALGEDDQTASHIMLTIPPVKYRLPYRLWGHSLQLSGGGKYLHESCAFRRDRNSVDKVGPYVELDVGRFAFKASYLAGDAHFYGKFRIAQFGQYGVKAMVMKNHVEETYALGFTWSF